MYVCDKGLTLGKYGTGSPNVAKGSEPKIAPNKCLVLFEWPQT